MDKIRIVDQHYYPESDELDLVINADAPRPAVSVLVDDYFYLRVDPETSEIVGATIFNASEWFAELARVFASQSLDNPDVRLFLERKLESLALQRA